LKEIIAIIRRHKMPETKKALEKAGFPGLTIQSVEGRGKQLGVGGMIFELDPGFNQYPSEKLCTDPPMKFIPKKMIILAVNDGDVPLAVEAIISANQTGNIGDGKIFVSPLEKAYTVRTGEPVL